MSVLLLTGPPAAGKNTVAAELAVRRPCCAVVDVDVVRHMVVHPHRAPWEGPEGRRQQELGARNATMLAHSFAGAGFDVILLDVLSARTLALYRQALAALGVQVVRLLPSWPELVRRNAARPVLKDEEIQDLYRHLSESQGVDATIDNTDLAPPEVVELLLSFWP